jgi:hypothetical protein
MLETPRTRRHFQTGIAARVALLLVALAISAAWPALAANADLKDMVADWGGVEMTVKVPR